MSDPTETVTLSSLTQLQREAAERTVARNARKDTWTYDEIVQVTEMLGLREYASGGRYGPSDGRRIAGQKRAAIQRHEESA